VKYLRFNLIPVTPFHLHNTLLYANVQIVRLCNRILRETIGYRVRVIKLKAVRTYFRFLVYLNVGPLREWTRRNCSLIGRSVYDSLWRELIPRAGVFVRRPYNRSRFLTPIPIFMIERHAVHFRTAQNKTRNVRYF